MPALGMNATLPASRTPPIYDPSEKTSVKHQFISAKTLSNALDKALTPSSDSEKTAYLLESNVTPDLEKPVYPSESNATSEEYPSAPNGASLTTFERSAGDPIKVFSNGLTEKFEIFTNREKFKSQAKLTFPLTYAFVEKVFNKQEFKLNDAFATFDGIHSYLKEGEYKKLPYFSEICGDTSDFKKNLESMETTLDSIESDFHDKSIYKILEGASEEETQVWHDKRARVEKGLASLKLTIDNLDSIIDSLKNDKVLSEAQSLGVRMITSVISSIGYVITLCGGLGTPLFCINLLANLGIETTQYSRKQEIKKWESFKERLEELRKKNPLMEEEVINQLLAANYRSQTTIKSLVTDNNAQQTQVSHDIKSLSTANENVAKLQEQQGQTLEELKAENAYLKEQNTLLIGDTAAARKAAEDSNKEIKQFITSATPIIDQLRIRKNSASSDDSGYLSSSPEDAPISRKEAEAIAREAAQMAVKQALAALQEQGLLKLA